MIHYSDRSRVETGHTCERKRFWNYHFNGKGIVPVGEGVDLTFGKAIHAHLEHPEEIADLADLVLATSDIILPDGASQNNEWWALYQGLTRTYNHFIKPEIERDYDVIAREVEITFDLAPGIKWMSRLDGVLRRKADGLYFVLEAKTSSWLDQLFKKKDTNFQLLMECEAMRRWLELKIPIEERLGDIQIGGSLLLVFNKGQKRKVSEYEAKRGLEGYRRLSPFTYWFKKDYANGMTKYSLDYTSGWDRVPTWTIPNWWDIAVETWPDRLREQVQLWPSVSFDQDRVESIIQQMLYREETIRDYGQSVNRVFPQNFDNCSSGAFGKECPYKSCCFSPQIGKDPVGSELYQWREPNHPQERLTKDE